MVDRPTGSSEYFMCAADMVCVIGKQAVKPCRNPSLSFKNIPVPNISSNKNMVSTEDSYEDTHGIKSKSLTASNGKFTKASYTCEYRYFDFAPCYRTKNVINFVLFFAIAYCKKMILDVTYLGHIPLFQFNISTNIN